jgi:hypothetical protein
LSDQEKEIFKPNGRFPLSVTEGLLTECIIRIKLEEGACGNLFDATFGYPGTFEGDLLESIEPVDWFPRFKPWDETRNHFGGIYAGEQRQSYTLMGRSEEVPDWDNTMWRMWGDWNKVTFRYSRRIDIENCFEGTLGYIQFDPVTGDWEVRCKKKLDEHHMSAELRIVRRRNQTLLTDQSNGSVPEDNKGSARQWSLAEKRAYGGNVLFAGWRDDKVRFEEELSRRNDEAARLEKRKRGILRVLASSALRLFVPGARQ